MSTTTPENTPGTSGTSGRHGIYGLLEEFRSRPRPENPSKLRLWIEQNAGMLVAEAERADAAGEGPVTQIELTPDVLAKVYSGPLPMNEFMDLLVETDSPYTVEIRAAQAAEAARLEKARAAHQATAMPSSRGAAPATDPKESA